MWPIVAPQATERLRATDRGPGTSACVMLRGVAFAYLW